MHLKEKAIERKKYALACRLPRAHDAAFRFSPNDMLWAAHHHNATADGCVFTTARIYKGIISSRTRVRSSSRFILIQGADVQQKRTRVVYGEKKNQFL